MNVLTVPGSFRRDKFFLIYKPFALIFTRTHTPTHTHTPTQTHTPTHPHPHTHPHTHTHTYTHAHTHIYTHIHPHTPTHPRTACHCTARHGTARNSVSNQLKRDQARDSLVYHVPLRHLDLPSTTCEHLRRGGMHLSIAHSSRTAAANRMQAVSICELCPLPGSCLPEGGSCKLRAFTPTITCFSIFVNF